MKSLVIVGIATLLITASITAAGAKCNDNNQSIGVKAHHLFHANRKLVARNASGQELSGDPMQRPNGFLGYRTDNFIITN
jgi:hypothetical protein